jgi:hypothetical protein
MQNVIVRKNFEDSFTAGRVVFYILGLLQVLLAFRLVFKFLGANPDSGFVSFIYEKSQILLSPFTAIFRSGATPGIETNGVLEPATIIAMVVYTLIAWGIVKLFLVFRARTTD